MRRFALMLLILLLSALLGPRPAGAIQSSGIQVLEQTEESNFHDNLAFHLRARTDTGQITRAEVYLSLGWSKDTQMQPAEPFTPTEEVEVKAVWDTSQLTIPPFIEINYYWVLFDGSGKPFQTETVHVEYTDSHHDWKRLEDEHVILFWYDQPDSFGQSFFTVAQVAYDHVARITGTTTDRPIRVVIYNNHEDFCYHFAPLTCEDWIGGQSYGISGITVQGSGNVDWLAFDAIPHELAHIFYSVILRNSYVRIPRWFGEGLAVYNEPTNHTAEMELVKAAEEKGELVPVADLDSHFSSLFEDTLPQWYAQSYSLIAYLIDAYGEETLGKIIMDLAKNTRFEKALTQETGLTLEQLDKNYHDWLGISPNTTPAATVAATAGEQPTPTAVPVATAEAQPVPTVVPTVPAEKTTGGQVPLFVWVVLGVVVGGIGITAGIVVGRRKSSPRPPEPPAS